MSEQNLTSVFDQMEPRSSGGAFFCKFTISYGFKVYAGAAQGVMDQRETVFRCDPFGPDAQKQAAKDAAKKFAEDHGVAASPAFGVELVVHKDTIKGRSVSWGSDMSKFYNRWASKNAEGKTVNEIDDLWIPLANRLGCTKPGSYWGKIVLVPTPTGRTEMYQNENRPVLMWVPDEIYPNESVCAKKAQEAGQVEMGAPVGASASASGEPLPKDYDEKTWMQYKDQVVADLKAKPLPAVASYWGIDAEFLAGLKSREGIA